MIRVAIANDTLLALNVLRRAIATNPAYELIWSAKDGLQAVELCASDTPDLMLMDLLMPGLDGVEATRQIMANSPCAILIVTGSVRNNTSKIFEAMSYGALDVVATPVLTSVVLTSASSQVPYNQAAGQQGAGQQGAGQQGAGQQGTGQQGAVQRSVSAAAEPLLKKMETVTAFIGKSIRREQANNNRPLPPLSPVGAKLPPLIAIGASTGGPKALAQILKGMPATCPAAIVIVQHIDQQFAPGLTNWLDEQSQLRVQLAAEGDRLQAGKVYVAAGGQHLVIGNDLALHYLRDECLQEGCRTPYRPSVDVFFHSVAEYWPQKGQAALLTGMGRDGALGLKSLRSAAWRTMAESEESCVVYGMPRTAIEQDAASQILSIKEISKALLDGLTERFDGMA